jgi:hypothetical protein
MPREIDISYSGCHIYFMIKNLTFFGWGGGGERQPPSIFCVLSFAFVLY